MSKMMVKDGDIWVPMEGLKGDTGPLPADNSVTNDALVTDGAKTNTAYLMGNRLTKDVEGELVTVDDSYPSAALSLTVDGKSTQVTTTGKNLLNPNVAVNANGWLRRRLTGNGYGTVQSSGGTNCNIFLVPLEDGQSLTYSRGGILKPGFHFAWTTDETLEIGSVLNNIVTLTNYSTRVFTNTTGGLVYAGVAASVNSAIFDNPSYLELAGAQLEYATALTSYEPYSGGVASPSPNWPQEIESVNDPTIYVLGKNLTSEIEQGSVSSYQDDVASTTICRLPASFDLEALAGSTVTCIGEVSGGTFEWDLAYLFETRSRYSYRHASGVSLSVPADAHDLRLVVSTSEGIAVTPSDFSNVQLEIGSTATDYEPYSGDVAQLQDITLRSLPDGTKDELHLTYIRPSTREGWAWYGRELVKRIDTKAWSTGFGQYHPNSSGHPRVRLSVGSNAKNGAANNLCNRFVYNSSTYNYGTYGDYYISGNYAYFILDDSIESIEAANTWLAEHPINLQYKLITPTSVNLEPIELPAMQSGTTNIWSDPSTNLSVTYERDRNIVISNLEAAVADLATS